MREQRLPGKGAHSRPICNGTQTAAYAPGLHGRTSQPPEPPARDAKNRTANPARGGLWFGFLCWLERSQTLARLMPAAKRRALWWAVVPMAALALFGM